MTQPSGWYDDPEDPTRVRYWDGVIWTGRTTPRINPNLERSGIGAQPAPQAGAQSTPEGRSPWESPGHQGGYGGAPGQFPQRKPSATTPDGQPLAGWWRRVVARILDGVIIGIVMAVLSLPFASWVGTRIEAPMRQWMSEFTDAMRTGSSTAPTLPAEVVKYVAFVSLISFVLYGLYEVFFLSRSGATPGKRAVGISVRLRDTPGPAPARQLINRYLVKEGGVVVGLFPVVGFAGTIFVVVNYLWPLWDNKNQALHDKVAETNVVLGPQPKPNDTGVFQHQR